MLVVILLLKCLIKDPTVVENFHPIAIVIEKILFDRMVEYLDLTINLNLKSTLKLYLYLFYLKQRLASATLCARCGSLCKMLLYMLGAVLCARCGSIC